MIKEKSCGAVSYIIKDGIYYFLIEKMKQGHFSLPKGHVENNEKEVETATREIKEETNLEVIIDTSFRETISYSPYKDCIKDVIFFVGKITSKDVKCQEAEVSNISFLPFNEAYNTLTYKEDKNVLLKAYLYLLKNSQKKYIIIGCPGSGKTYFSKYLTKYTNIPLYHLDMIYWYDNYKHISDEKLRKKENEIMENDCYIIDGHFQNTLENRIKNTEVVIFFSLPSKTCINGVKHRIKSSEIRDDIKTTCKEEEISDKFMHCMKHFKQKFYKDIRKWLSENNCNVLTINTKKMQNEIINYIK